DIAVVTLELLLGHELHAVVRRLLAALTVLAGTVVPVAVERALLPAPEIDAEASVDLVLGGVASAHGALWFLGFVIVVPIVPRQSAGGGVSPPAFSGIRRRTIAGAARKSNPGGPPKPPQDSTKPGWFSIGRRRSLGYAKSRKPLG